ncbi:TRM11 family SAM-dependent methyltransferase [Anaerobacillus sp. MEB173]|uniref:TRM11 family SAM-dependent methyltransferase n=1 Tax=Anaerobacillus sp. MEB173 TaxID=3383345 RepID=UPI003F8FCFC4
MNDVNLNYKSYLYTYTYREEEHSLCRLEMRAFFGFDTSSSIVESSLPIDPSRSPFMRERIAVLFKERSIEELLTELASFHVKDATFKVMFVHNPNVCKKDKVSYEQRRLLERKTGLQIIGQVNLKDPTRVFALMSVGDQWVFGDYLEGQSVWHIHQRKPNDYSTALSTRVARAVVNIAVPRIQGVKVIDPCCGIGTVLVEAKSMGIDIVGSDINPLALIGARENLAYFGYQTDVVKRDIRDVKEKYDIAIIDLPYNLCSVITPGEWFEMLQCAQQFADRVVVVTIENIDNIIKQAGFIIQDRCEIKKGKVIRQVLVCESIKNNDKIMTNY